MTGIQRTVIPAQAGIQPACVLHWIPARAGMTTVISGSMLSNAASPRGRKAIFTSENLFRAILVMQREGFDYREASHV